MHLRAKLKPDTATPPAAADALFLPDFCERQIVFSVIVIAELLAFVLTLATPSVRGGDWVYLSLLSLFIQWIALSSAGLLCIARPRLAGLDTRHAAAVAFALPLAVTVLFSEIVYWLAAWLSKAIFQVSAGHWEFLLRNLAISAIANFLTLRYFYLQHELSRNARAEAESRLQALQARIRPHFLFNSLNTVASLTRSNPKLAEEAVEDLADLFRMTLADAQSRVTLAEELALAQRYIHMEALRLGQRLQMQWDTDKLPRDALLPALTLQPLLENAIRHGIEPLPNGGVVQCLGTLDGNRIVITLRNPVAGPEPAARPGGHHMALDNIRQRLNAHFPDAAKVVTQHRSDYYLVQLSFPYITAHAHPDR